MKTLKNTIAKIFLLASFFFALQASAQANRLSYQAVIRNTAGVLVANVNVGIQISILQTTATGTAVFRERHTTLTNANGLATLEIGGGTLVVGNFTTIDWSNGPYFIKTETDPAGGTNYTISGTSQMLSVPYALFAATSRNALESWGTNGNAASASDFIGSTNLEVLRFKTSGTERMQIAIGGNVGIGKQIPTEKLDINGNLRVSGALMPNNNAGTTDQVLLSNGVGVAPDWSPFKFGNITATTEISKYFGFLTITTPWLANTQRQFKITAPYIRVDSALSLSFRGSPYTPAIHDNLIIYNIIATAGEILITTFNKGATLNGTLASPTLIPVVVMGMF